MVKALFVAMVVLLSLPAASLAQDPNVGSAEGEVRKIDKSTKKITVRHGPVSGLDMEPMTMVLQVGDPAMLEKLAVGDKIKFTVRRGGGAFTLQSFELAK